jgi:hypothetical protein
VYGERVHHHDLVLVGTGDSKERKGEERCSGEKSEHGLRRYHKRRGEEKKVVGARETLARRGEETECDRKAERGRRVGMANASAADVLLVTVPTLNGLTRPCPLAIATP